MKTLFTIIWLFPIIFMIHDFEEILMINVWQEKNKQYIQSRKGKYIPYNFNGSTASIAFGVALEFVIISALTTICYLLSSFIAWFGFFTAFTLHLIFHIIMTINFKKYVPGVATSIIFIPLCFFMLHKVTNNILPNYNVLTLSFSILISILIMISIIFVLHKAVKHFNLWLKMYKTNSI
ncbi:hypothetical protein BJV85_003287 [Clostridium acetobutylicum]|uniref:Predicted membrane protein CF-9 family n=1 Tax=Clostridium acetobutylicum (strain ATCC 824 / DSM 792 / JCM 1419 / IAM 19013 / LMG 5710 / NBRC 13948 / NRRL B-527 / VKM B-1787 / 2291 / W) TaxID=272562 RepID=Q97L44_CLOAB|nr:MULTISPECIES: HXXEE domain-containing protein [Clostridium]AAK78698.1 Predicted membrane protein; CF-9 family [Clostridium acetobutylicum ATCC 824]ADZ19772.1 membrane protein; CF-9 family [Clostridium acetobutylicum EA 2018]AEI31393.1 hypothetical protein SMB_G0738 [Clostridium acetobutylicum DSM 1731]AWV80417.1 HXXEE domain-containing protein [Clostridium acetobutylicum]MBC2392607.1 HXXEE domain-containing protein [Clostridium acetobutylicum]